MENLTIGFGVVLIVLGEWGFVSTGSRYPTAMIPTWAGFLFVLFGALAHSKDLKRKKLWMHAAASVAMLLFFGTMPSIVDEIMMLRGKQFPYPVAVEEKAATSVLCLLFLIICVRSFISARKARKLAAQS
jgi:fucose 4-O-acetylase-like acetyltransferase